MLPLHPDKLHQNELTSGHECYGASWHLAVETTVDTATSTIVTALTALSAIRRPRLPGVLEPHRLAVGAADEDLEHGGKLAVDAGIDAAGDAELRDAADGVLDRVEEGQVEAVFGGAAVGACGTLVLLVLHDVDAAPAGDVTLV